MLGHFEKAAKIQADWLGRNATESMKAVQLFANTQNQDKWRALRDELFAMNTEATRRFSEFQKDWTKGWMEWVAESSQPKTANTASKLVSQEFDVMSQALILLGLQSAGFVELMENINVSYGYWLNRKLSQEEPQS